MHTIKPARGDWFVRWAAIGLIVAAFLAFMGTCGTAHAASARRMPISYNTHTVGVGKDYATIQAAVTDRWTGRDMVTAQKGEVLLVDAGVYPETLDLTRTHDLTNASYFPVLMAAPGSEHKGIAGAGVILRPALAPGGYILKVGLEANGSGCIGLYDLVLDGSLCSGFTAGLLVRNPRIIYAVGVWIRNVDATYGSFYMDNTFAMYEAPPVAYFVDCLADNVACGFGMDSVAYNQTAYLYNFTAANASAAGWGVFSMDHSALVGKNVVLQGFAHESFIYNDSTFTTTGYKYNAGVTFVSATNLHLDPTDTVAKGQGTDLSADGVFPFTDDVDLQTAASPWNIGADQPAGAAPTINGGRIIWFF